MIVIVYRLIKLFLTFQYILIYSFDQINATWIILTIISTLLLVLSWCKYSWDIKISIGILVSCKLIHIICITISVGRLCVDAAEIAEIGEWLLVVLCWDGHSITRSIIFVFISIYIIHSINICIKLFAFIILTLTFIL